MLQERLLRTPAVGLQKLMISMSIRVRRHGGLHMITVFIASCAKHHQYCDCAFALINLRPLLSQVTPNFRLYIDGKLVRP